MNPSEESLAQIHLSVWSAIPWVLNGSAEPALQSEVRQHIEQCVDCRREFHYQQMLQRQFAALVAADAAQPAHRVDAGLRRLMRQLDALEPAAAAAPVLEQRRGRGVAVMSMAAMLVIAVAVQAVTAVVLLRGQQPASADYATLARESAAAPAARLRVVLSPQASIAEVQQLLQQHELQIVGGPNAAGAWALAPSSAGLDLQAAQVGLRADARVRFVEMIEAPQ